ncbi:hypothetical protein Fmac_016082 [Flemingia macrophylla]|uniref:Ribosomal protein L20 n=1 Tax=Flemingia macrophylla TaxID=520843 RepID=A0ABD1MGE0_9FABA
MKRERSEKMVMTEDCYWREWHVRMWRKRTKRKKFLSNKDYHIVGWTYWANVYLILSKENVPYISKLSFRTSSQFKNEEVRLAKKTL